MQTKTLYLETTSLRMKRSIINLLLQVPFLFSLLSLVTSKPFIKTFPEDMTVTEGNRVEFPVKVSGTPDPQLTWYHESTRLDNDYAHEISTDGTMIIATTEMKHSGTYRLVASNSAGTCS